MAKKEVFKIKNDMFIDSASIMHNKELLSKIVIHDSGSNSNGLWIRWENGFMLCCGSKYAASTLPNTYGNWYASDEILLNDFPISFVGDLPLVLCQLKNANWSSKMQVVTYSEQTLDNPGSIMLIGPTKFYNSQGGNVVYYAIGKWK